MKPLIDITMTATRRPEVIFQTIHSFYEKCFRLVAKDCRVIINVDPTGHNIPSIDVLNIVSSFFPCYSIRMPLECSFPQAFKWVWQNSTAPWVFHLEEDWELMQSVNIKEMIAMMEKFPQLALLRLPFTPSGEINQKNWSHFYPWNGHFYQLPEGRKLELGFCGHPSLIRGSFVQKAWPYIDTTINPEKQFHHGHPVLMDHVQNYEYGNWGRPGHGAYVRDIGRQWMIEHGFFKEGNKSHFTKWGKQKTIEEAALCTK